MGWTEQQKYKMEEIAGEINCPNDFRCFKSEPEELLKARKIGINGYLDCPEEESKECKLSVPLGKRYLCKCPVRVYIAQNIES